MPRTVSRVAIASCLLFATLTLTRCGKAADSAVTSKAKVCTPGTGYTCVRGTCNGFQQCKPDGSGYTPCECGTTSRVRDAGDSSDADGGGHDDGRERCDNGVDDDGDGKIDCADADCAAMRCSPAAPSGWQGPVVFRESEDEATCAGAFQHVAWRGGSDPQADPASCSQCTCDGGSSCASAIDFASSSEEQCGGKSCSTSINQACAEISPACIADLTTAYVKTKLASGAGCQASLQHADKSEPSWRTHALACSAGALSAGGCGKDELCAPAADGGEGFEARYCIYRDGEHACPNATFSDRRIYQRAFQDTRACSACNCDGDECQYRWRVFNADDTSCATPLLELSISDQFEQVNPKDGKLRVGAMISGGGACKASGGESSGDVSAEDPVTLCCNE
jgi:hypothetical protein